VRIQLRQVMPAIIDPPSSAVCYKNKSTKKSYLFFYFFIFFIFTFIHYMNIHKHNIEIYEKKNHLCKTYLKFGKSENITTFDVI